MFFHGYNRVFHAPSVYFGVNFFQITKNTISHYRVGSRVLQDQGRLGVSKLARVRPSVLRPVILFRGTQRRTLFPKRRGVRIMSRITKSSTFPRRRVGRVNTSGAKPAGGGVVRFTPFQSGAAPAILGDE